MAIISVTDAAQIKKTLEENLVDDVRVVLFVEPLPKLFVPGRPAGAGLNRETQQLLEELAALSDKIKLEVHDATEEPQAAQSYGVDSFPAIVIEKNGHKNVRFYGFPGGYEFATLLEAFVKVSSHTSPLSQETKDELKKIDEQLLIQVFVTPT